VTCCADNDDIVCGTRMRWLREIRSMRDSSVSDAVWQEFVDESVAQTVKVRY